jgi:hypothetical protein
MSREVSGKEIYAFCEHCINIQKEGLNELKEKLKGNIPGTEKKKIRNLIKLTEEKIDFLRNTESIIEACYEKTGKKFKFDLKKHKKFLKKVGLVQNDKK